MGLDNSEYIESCQQELDTWLNASPGLVARGFGRTTRPLVNTVAPLLPESLLESSFAKLNDAGRLLAWRKRFLASVGQLQIVDLALADLASCDEKWRSQRKRMMLLAAGEGALTGMGGAAGWILDVPALLLFALEGIHRAAYCFGVEPEDRAFSLAIMGLAAANSPEEKQAAWALAMTSQFGAGQWQTGMEQVLRPSMAKQAMTLSLEKLAGQLSLNLGRRKALGMVPLAGALVGGSVNAWYLSDVMRASRYVCHAIRFQEPAAG